MDAKDECLFLELTAPFDDVAQACLAQGWLLLEYPAVLAPGAFAAVGLIRPGAARWVYVMPQGSATVQAAMAVHDGPPNEDWRPRLADWLAAIPSRREAVHEAMRRRA